MSAAALEHRTPDCTGRWLRSDRPPVVWRCDTCGAVYRHTAAVALAAVRENAMGTLLRALPRA